MNKSDNKKFLDVIDMSTDDVSIMDSSKQEKSATDLLTKDMLSTIFDETDEILNDFGKQLRDDTISVTTKIGYIQKLEEVALAETVKSFNPETMDSQRLQASTYLLKMASTLKSTLKLKHTLQLKEDIDFKHPKISKAFSFLIDMFIETMQENGVCEEVQITILESIEVKTFQMEDILQEIFRGVPVSELGRVGNPFSSENQVTEEMDFLNVYEVTEEQVEDKTESFNLAIKEYRSKLQKESLSKRQRASKVVRYKKYLRKKMGIQK